MEFRMEPWVQLCVRPPRMVGITDPGVGLSRYEQMLRGMIRAERNRGQFHAGSRAWRWVRRYVKRARTRGMTQEEKPE